MKKTRIFAVFLSMALSLASLPAVVVHGEDKENTAFSEDVSYKIGNSVKEYISVKGGENIPVELFWDFDFSLIDEKAMAEADKYVTLLTGYKKGTEEFDKEVNKKYIELTMDAPDIGFKAQEKRFMDHIGLSEYPEIVAIRDIRQCVKCELTIEQINRLAELEQIVSMGTPGIYIYGPKEGNTYHEDIPKIEGLSDSVKIDRTVNYYFSRTGNTTAPCFINWEYDFSEYDEEAMMEALKYTDSVDEKKIVKMSVQQRQNCKNAKYFELVADDPKYSYETQENALLDAIGVDGSNIEMDRNKPLYKLTIEQINKATEMDKVLSIGVPLDIALPDITTVAPSDTITTTTTTAAESVKGDANCDGSVDMADAVLIMQALANPDKYGIDGTAENHLTEQGKANADMDGDGLTVGDAQTIQKKLLGLE